MYWFWLLQPFQFAAGSQYCKEIQIPYGKLGSGSIFVSGTQQITCLQRRWRCIQNGGYGEKGEKNWVRDAKVKINKMVEKAEVQFKKKQEKQTRFAFKSLRNTEKC